MIRLRVLGSLDLRNEEGGELRAVLAQPKRLALLTYLAVAEPSGFLRRDTLLGLFWPELDEAHARDALNQSLRFLRQELGRDVITSRGTDEVAVGPDRVWCDARAFRHAVASGRPADALDLYRGELLKGFYVSDPGGFEEWVESERAALRQLAAEAAGALAAKHEADRNLTMAVRWGRRAVSLAGDDERAFRRLLALLARAGDRAGALQAYDDFTRRLRVEYSVEPDAETRALVEQIRGQATTIAVASPPQPLFRSPLTSSPPPIGITGVDAGLRPGGALANGRYVIERIIGAGGMASVYLAQDIRHERRVAIKVLQYEVAQGAGSGGILREIRIAAGLQHPHIVPLFDSGESDGRVFYVMPYIDGETLRARMDRGPRLTTIEAVRVLREVADALAHAHGQGIVHRDIKPENVLLTGGPSTGECHALVADFGLAKALDVTRAGSDRDRTLSGSGVGVGTPGYMAPEQATGDHVDGRADLYAWGVLAYELLSGSHPFPGRTAQQMIRAHISETPVPLSERRPDIPPALAELVMRCLSKDPDGRPATGGELLATLDQAVAVSDPSVVPVLDGVPSQATTSPREPSARPVTRSRGTLQKAGLALAAVAVISAGAAFVLNARRAHAFAERDWILVSDFDGAPADSGLAEAVRELTTAELNQSSFLSTLPRQQLNATMRLAGIPDTTHVGPDLARELAFRSAVRAVLVGSVRHIGRTEYSIVLHVVSAEDGSDIWSAAGAATEQTLIPTVQRLVRDLRAGLGERRSAIEAALPLDHIATPSFDAYRKYAEGLRLQTRGDGRGSNRLLREALALDTAFASAWFTMGWNYLNDRMADSARWAFGQALARRERLSEPQRYRLEADVAYTLDYDLPAAIRAYDLYLARWPRSWAVQNNRGNYLLALGRYEDALESYERAVAAHPFGPRQAQIQVANRAATLIALGRLTEAERVARDLTGPFALYVRLMLDVASERWHSADSLGAAVSSAPSTPGWLKVQATAVSAASRAARGAVRSADASLAQAAAGASPDVTRWLHRARLLLAVVSRAPVPPTPPVLQSDTTPAGRLTAGLWTAIAGDTAAARVAMSVAASLSPVDRRRLGSGPLLLEAWLEARGNRWRHAADLVAPRALAGEHDSALLDRVGSLSLRWLAAEAYAASGRPDSAAAMLELAIKPERMPGNEFALRGLVVPFAHRRLAELYTTMGRRDVAVRHWEAFLATFTNPDRDLTPLVAEARVALRRLQEA